MIGHVFPLDYSHVLKCAKGILKQSPLEKVLVRRFVWQNRHSRNLVWNETLTVSCCCCYLILFSSSMFYFSAVSCSLVPVRATKPFNDVESCLLQEEICGGRGYTGKPSWIFTKSNTFFFSFLLFYHLVKSTVKMSDCASPFWSSMQTTAAFLCIWIGLLAKKRKLVG